MMYINDDGQIIGKYRFTDKYGDLMSLKEELLFLKQFTPTKDELRLLQKWLAEGNSFYDNPYHIYGEDGWLKNFIEANRDIEWMTEANNAKQL